MYVPNVYTGIPTAWYRVAEGQRPSDEKSYRQ